jgi:hypothetical protein
MNSGELPHDVFIAALVDSIATRGAAQADGLLSGMTHRFWPGGTSDRTVPSARRWLSRWSPRRVELPQRECTCAAGRCELCN